MPANTISATITAKAGPGLQATSMVLSGLKAFTVDLNENVLSLFGANPAAYPYKEFDLVGVTTFTVTISGGNYTLTVS